MKQPAIQAEQLTKRYRLGQGAAVERTLGERLYQLGGKLLGRSAQQTAPAPLFHALDDVGFDVEPGEVFGVIGRNGAGKSTLLKILSRITEPTSGQARLHGRVGSLLEVGTGFHPELTGRENIFLNGAILGMKRREIAGKFDAIVDFAEIEKFLDTPVKRYSSGMYVRLAFAVAAHLEPEILLIDEVLAVGDAGFQAKCLGKMSGIADSGRTVVFVSHDMGAVTKLCDRVMLLDQGKACDITTSQQAVDQYLRLASNWRRDPAGVFNGPLAKTIRFDDLRINGINQDQAQILSPADTITLRATGYASEDTPAFRTTFSIFQDGVRILTQHDSELPTQLPAGRFVSEAQLPANLLRPGAYTVGLGGYREGQSNYLWAGDVLRFTISETWSKQVDPINLGLINLPGHGTREHMGSDTANTTTEKQAA